MPLGGRKDTLVLGGESMSTRGSTGSEVARIAAEVGAETRSPVSVREFSGTGKWSKRGSTRSSGGAKQLPAPPGDDKPKARPSDVAEPEPAKEQATAEPATVWQAVLLSNRGGAQVKVDDRFKHVWEAIRSKTAALTERLKLNYQSKSLTSNLRKLEKLTDTDTARQQEKTRGQVLRSIRDHGIVCETAVDARAKQTYRLQGNLDMYNSQNQTQRKRNRINAAVVSKLDEWWECMPKDSEGVINKSIYTWASQLLFYAFVPGSTEDDCQMCIAEDWRTDSKGKKILNKQMFSDAMFQFADVWCESAEYREYVDLLAACIAICSRGPAYVPVEKEDDEDLPTDVRAPAPVSPTQTHQPRQIEQTTVAIASATKPPRPAREATEPKGSGDHKTSVSQGEPVAATTQRKADPPPPHTRADDSYPPPRATADSKNTGHRVGETATPPPLIRDPQQASGRSPQKTEPVDGFYTSNDKAGKMAAVGKKRSKKKAQRGSTTEDTSLPDIRSLPQTGGRRVADRESSSGSEGGDMKDSDEDNEGLPPVKGAVKRGSRDREGERTGKRAQKAEPSESRDPGKDSRHPHNPFAKRESWAEPAIGAGVKAKPHPDDDSRKPKALQPTHPLSNDDSTAGDHAEQTSNRSTSKPARGGKPVRDDPSRGSKNTKQPLHNGDASDDAEANIRGKPTPEKKPLEDSARAHADRQRKTGTGSAENPKQQRGADTSDGNRSMQARSKPSADIPGSSTTVNGGPKETAKKTPGNSSDSSPPHHGTVSGPEGGDGGTKSTKRPPPPATGNLASVNRRDSSPPSAPGRSGKATKKQNHRSVEGGSQASASSGEAAKGSRDRDRRTSGSRRRSKEATQGGPTPVARKEKTRTTRKVSGGTAGDDDDRAFVSSASSEERQVSERERNQKANKSGAGRRARSNQKPKRSSSSISSSDSSVGESNALDEERGRPPRASVRSARKSPARISDGAIIPSTKKSHNRGERSVSRKRSQPLGGSPDPASKHNESNRREGAKQISSDSSDSEVSQAKPSKRRVEPKTGPKAPRTTRAASGAGSNERNAQRDVDSGTADDQEGPNGKTQVVRPRKTSGSAPRSKAAQRNDSAAIRASDTTNDRSHPKRGPSDERDRNKREASGSPSEETISKAPSRAAQKSDSRAIHASDTNGQRQPNRGHGVPDEGDRHKRESNRKPSAGSKSSDVAPSSRTTQENGSGGVHASHADDRRHPHRSRGGSDDSKTGVEHTKKVRSRSPSNGPRGRRTRNGSGGSNVSTEDNHKRKPTAGDEGNSLRNNPGSELATRDSHGTRSKYAGRSSGRRRSLKNSEGGSRSSSASDGGNASGTVPRNRNGRRSSRVHCEAERSGPLPGRQRRSSSRRQSMQSESSVSDAEEHGAHRIGKIEHGPKGQVGHPITTSDPRVTDGSKERKGRRGSKRRDSRGLKRESSGSHANSGVHNGITKRRSVGKNTDGSDSENGQAARSGTSVAGHDRDGYEPSHQRRDTDSKADGEQDQHASKHSTTSVADPNISTSQGSSPERHEPREFGSDEHFDQVSDAGRSEPDYDCDLGQTSSGTDGRATAGGRNSLLLLDEEREELERTARLASQELEVAKRRERRVRQCEAVSQGFLAEAALREVEAQHATDAWHRVEETLSDELQELEKEAALIREIGGAEDAALNEVVEEVRVVKSKVDEVAKLQKEVLDEVSEREIEAITRQIEFEESTAKASEEDEEEVEEPELEPESEPSNTSKLPNSIARGDNVTAEGDNTGVGRRTGGKKPKRVTSRSAIAHSIARRERAADRMDTVDDKTVDLLNGARARGKNRMLSRVARLQNDLKGIPSQEKAALDELQLLIAEEKIKHSEDEALILQRIRDIAKQKRDRNDAVRRGIAADAKKHQGRAYRATRGRGKAEHTAKRPGEPDSDSSEDSSSCSTASDEAAGDTSESHVVNGRAKHSRRRRSSVVGIPGFTPTNLSKNGLLAKPIDYDVDDFTTEDWGIVVERLARKRDELLKKVQRKARRDDRKDERAHTLAESALRRVHDARRGAAQAKKRVLEDVLQYAPDTAEERRARAQRKLKELQASEELDEATMQQEKKELANLEAAARADRNARRAHVDTLTTAYADEIKQLRAAKSKKHVIDASARRIPLETPGNVRKAAKPSQSGGTQQKTSGEDGLGYDIDPYRPNGPQGGNFGQGMRFGKAQQGYDGDWDGLPAYGSVETGRRHVFLSEQKGDAAWELFLAERARVREALRVKREAFADARAAEELERSLSWREWLRLQRLENLREERERLKRLRELAGKQAKWRDQLLARLRGKEEREMEEKRRLQQAIADRQIRVDRFLRGRQQAADRAKEEKMQTLHERTRRMQQREREAELRLVSLRQEEAAQRIERQRTARVGGVKHRKRSGDVTGSPHVVFTGTEGHQSGRTGKIGISTRRAVQLSRKERETIEKEQFDREAARLRDLAEAKRLRGKLLTLLRNRLEDLQSGTVVQGVPESSQRDLRQFEREKRKAEQEKILAEKARQQARLRARIEHDRHASELRRAFILEQHALAKQQRLHSKANAPVYVGVSEDNVSTAFSSTGHPVVIQAFPSKPVNGAPSRTGRLASTNGTDRGLASIVEENTGSQARSFAPFIVTGYKPGGTAGNTARRRSVSNQQKRVRPAEQVEFDLSPDVTSLRTQRQSHALVCSDDVEDRLESTAWRLESEEFHERAAEYEKLRMSTRAVYLSECTRGRMKPNSLFTKACSDKPMHFVLKELDLGSNYVASITPFLDIIRLSKGMKRIMLRDNGLRNEDVRSLAETLQDHPSIEELDLTGNKHLTVVAGRLLLSLVQYRQRMTAVRLQGTNVPSNVVQQISRCLDWNAQGRQIAPGQVQMAAKMFDEIDTDNDGIVSAVEAEQYGKKHAQAQAMPLRRASLASGASTDVRFLQKLRNAATARDIMRVATDSTKVTFPEFLQAVFPQCPKTQILQAAATRPLASDAPQHPSPNDKSAQRRSFARTPQVSSTEIDTFFHNYAQDGYLSLEQLAAGLGESDTAKLHPIFLAFDSDEDNLLTLDEFREFMSAV